MKILLSRELLPRIRLIEKYERNRCDPLDDGKTMTMIQITTAILS